MKKSSLVTWIIILAVVILAIIILNRPSIPPETPTEIIKCIGQKSTLYVQLGCHACETQEKIFGKDYQYLNVIDCFYNRDSCEGIEYTPTWKINDQKYSEVFSIEKLQELTGC